MLDVANQKALCFKTFNLSRDNPIMTNKNDNAKNNQKGQTSNGDRHTFKDGENTATNRNDPNGKRDTVITQSSMTPPRPGSNPNKK